jgi:hypothetical protein
LHKQRIQGRVNVVRRDVRDARDHDVALAFNRNFVLTIVELENSFVHRLRSSGETSDQLILRRDRVQKFSTRGTRKIRERPLHCFPFHAIAEREVVLVSSQDVVALGKHLVVERGLDVKYLAVLIDEMSEADDFVIQLRRRRIHIRMRIADRLRFVMSAQRFIIAQTDCDRLVTAVHRDEIDVEIDEQIALCRPTVHTKRFVVTRMAERDQVVVILGIMIVETIGMIFVEDLVPDHPTHFPIRHLPVKRVCNDQMNVVDSVRPAHVEYDLEHRLSHIRRRHRWKR